jgi:hypothetical protein
MASLQNNRGPFWDAVEGRAALPRATASLGLELIDADIEHGTIELAFEALERRFEPPALTARHEGRCHGVVIETRRGANARYGKEERPALAGPLVRPGRFELPRSKRTTRPSTLRVYQFRHRRVAA